MPEPQPAPLLPQLKALSGKVAPVCAGGLLAANATIYTLLTGPLQSVLLATTGLATLGVFAFIIHKKLDAVSQRLWQPLRRAASALEHIELQHTEQLNIDTTGASAEATLVINRINQLLAECTAQLRSQHNQANELGERAQLVRQLLEQAPQAILQITLGGDIRQFNRMSAQLLGTKATEMNGKNLLSYLSAEDQTCLLAYLGELKQNPHDRKTIDLTLNQRLGQTSVINVTASLLGEGIEQTAILVLGDVSESRRAQNRLRESENRLKLAMRATRCAVWDYEPASGNYWWSGEFSALLGFEAEELKASPVTKQDLIHPDDIGWVTQCMDRYLKKETNDYNPEYRMRRKDGSWMWIEDRAIAEWDSQGIAIRISGIISDCSERKRFEQQMMYMATHDSLTDLPNRTLLHDRLEHALIGNNRKGLNVAVLLVDIDRFKLINDSLGHDIGDQLIRAVAQRLLQNIRPTDTLARSSGDEFVLICEDLSTPQEAARVAKRLLSAMSQSFMVENNQLAITISLGISVSPVDGQNGADLLRHADTAMHSAKAAGGNSYRFFVNEMNQEAVKRLTLERYLNEAIERQQFLLHYQPKIDINTLNVIGAEALIRWPHRKLGNVSPLQFIPIAEETGAILAVGEWVIRETLSQLAVWRERGCELVPIAINLSGKQLMAGGIDELILRLLREYEIPPHLLEVEVTESVMAKMDKVLPVLRRLRDAGIGIALDDFGTGYSSLAYLRQLPLTALKIDRSFVRDVPEKTEANSVAKIILDMGRQLGLKVVAEGVETEAQLAFLRQSQCDIGQGWLFAKALTPSQFQAKLKTSRPAEKG